MPAYFGAYPCIVLPYMRTNDHGAMSIHQYLLDAQGAGIVDLMTTGYEVLPTWH